VGEIHWNESRVDAPKWTQGDQSFAESSHGRIHLMIDVVPSFERGIISIFLEETGDEKKAQ
jgi:hypothetical protein